MRNLKVKIFLLVVFVMGSLSSFAQEQPGEFPTGDEGLDPAQAPISDHLWILGILGLTIVFYKVFNSKTQKVQ